MDREAWQAIIHEVVRGSDMSLQVNNNIYVYIGRWILYHGDHLGTLHHILYAES